MKHAPTAPNKKLMRLIHEVSGVSHEQSVIQEKSLKELKEERSKSGIMKKDPRKMDS